MSKGVDTHPRQSLSHIEFLFYFLFSCFVVCLSLYLPSTSLSISLSHCSYVIFALLNSLHVSGVQFCKIDFISQKTYISMTCLASLGILRSPPQFKIKVCDSRSRLAAHSEFTLTGCDCIILYHKMAEETWAITAGLAARAYLIVPGHVESKFLH